MKLIKITKQAKYKKDRMALFLCPYCGGKVEKTIKDGERTQSCGCIRRLNLNPNRLQVSKIHYLGDLCNYGHEYHNTRKSLRYISSKGCVICRKINNKIYNNREISLPKPPPARRGKESLQCIYYRECLKEAAHNSKKLYCNKCERKVLVEDFWQNEVEYRPCIGHSKLTEYPISS